MITKEWHDFILGGGVLVRSAEERLSLQGAKRLVRRELVEQLGDKFEAMEITDLGNVTVWTTTKVWCIRKERGLENLIYLPRNPPPS